MTDAPLPDVPAAPSSRRIRVSDVRVPADRLRPVDKDVVEIIAESVRDHGLEHPIIVRPDPAGIALYVLVAGAHRIGSFQLLGLAEIEAHIRDLTDDEARIVEIDENLMRKGLEALDRAVFMAVRKATWERMHPESAHGKAKKPKKDQDVGKVANIATFARFSKEAAKSTGLSERSVQLACRIYDELGPDAISKLRSTSLAGNQAQLLILANMNPAERATAIDAAVAARAPTVSAALRSVGLGRPAVNADDETYRKLCELWDRAGAKVRRRFLARIGVGDDADDETAVA